MMVYIALKIGTVVVNGSMRRETRQRGIETVMVLYGIVGVTFTALVLCFPLDSGFFPAAAPTR